MYPYPCLIPIEFTMWTTEYVNVMCWKYYSDRFRSSRDVASQSKKLGCIYLSKCIYSAKYGISCTLWDGVVAWHWQAHFILATLHPWYQYIMHTFTHFSVLFQWKINVNYYASAEGVNEILTFILFLFIYTNVSTTYANLVGRLEQRRTLAFRVMSDSSRHRISLWCPVQCRCIRYHLSSGVPCYHATSSQTRRHHSIHVLDSLSLVQSLRSVPSMKLHYTRVKVKVKVKSNLFEVAHI